MDWVTLVALLLYFATVKAEETCLSADENPYLLFGDKTAYIFANSALSNNKFHDVPGCEPIAFWLLNRHGSHNPEIDELSELKQLVDFKENIISNYRNGNFRNTNQRICTADLNLLEQWKWSERHNATFAGDLTSDGYITTQQLAQAWKQRYPGLLTDNRQNYLFKYADDQRSTTSFKAFTEGLFKTQADGYDIPKETDDKLLMPYKSCPAWIKDVKENNETLSQKTIFESKQEYREMITNISLRLGFNYDLHRSTILSMYQLCRYKKAWDVALISPWCSAFSKEDLKRLEYAEDLETYYKYGYGNSLNQKLGCSLVKNMMTLFRKHIDNEQPQQPKAVISFSDAATLLLTLSTMGGHRDSAPLTGDNYKNYAQGRTWTTSTIAPFDANLAAVLYKCNPNGKFQVKDRFQVLFLENEKPMYLEGCRVGLCEWTTIQERFGAIADQCDLKFCNAASSLNLGLGLVFVALLRYLVL